MGERVRERIISTFSQHQLREVGSWFAENMGNGPEDIEQAVEAIADEKERNRTRWGISLIASLERLEKTIEDVR